MPDVILREFKSVVLDGSGNGTAKLGPISAMETWKPDNVHVSVNGPVVNEATCSLYMGDSATAPNFRDATFSGSTGDSTDRLNADTIKVGYNIFAVWVGGDAGKPATVVVTGIKQI